METLIPIFGILMPFLTAIAIILIIYLAKINRERSRNLLIEKAIENGKEISPEFFKSTESAKKPSDPLTSAMVSIGAGIGLFGAFYFFFDGFKFAAFGLIPLFIGLGQLVAYFINKKNKTQE